MKTDLFEERHVDDVTIRKFLLSYDKFINVSLMYLFKRRLQKMSKSDENISDTFCCAWFATFFSYLTLMSSVICY